MPILWVCKKASKWLPRPLQIDRLRQEDQGIHILIRPIPQPFRFHGRDESPQEERFHSTNEHVEESRPGSWPSHHGPQQVWDCGPQWLDQWALQPPGMSTFTGSWIWEWHELGVHGLISVIMVWQIWGPLAPMSGLTLQGNWRTHENQPTSLQRWGHNRHGHLPELALGPNSVLMCWIPRLYPPSLCHLFLARIPRQVGEKFWYGHHLGWHPHYTGWTL